MNDREQNREKTASYKFSMALLFYNEEENIIPVVSSLKDTLTEAGLSFELILVNNGSQDRTPLLIDQLVSRDPVLSKVTVESNRGYGWGALQGLKAARGEWIGFMGGDGQIAPEDVVKLFRSAHPGYDLIKVRRIQRLDGFTRRWVSNIYIMMVCLLFDLPFYDINATPRIFHRSWLGRLEFTSRDWFLDAEMMIKARVLGMKVREIPIIFRKRQGGSSNVNVLTSLEFLKNIARFRLGEEFRQWKIKTRSKS